MAILAFPAPPIQDDFTENDLAEFRTGRRQLRTEWPNVLYPPNEPSENWRIVLPFPNTYENAFASMCGGVNYYAHTSPRGALVIYLNDTTGDPGPPAEVLEWASKVGSPVAMKDFLAISFALDFDRNGGNPTNPQTVIGALRAAAKPYGSAQATLSNLKAADDMARHCTDFIKTMTCYSRADCIVAVPPSDPSKPFNLPRHIAAKIAVDLGIGDESDAVTGRPRPSIKNQALEQKLATLRGTITVRPGALKDKNVLLLDDLYQSGLSMNYCALALRQAGANRILGLACEKTCRNTDNVS